jgi:putative membrane protein
MAKSLLSESDKLAIAEVIRKAESSTSGEIVFSLTDAAAKYRHATLQAALAGMVASAAAYLALPLMHSISLLLWIELISFAGFYALFSKVSWRRWFISAAEMDARVRDAAFTEFYSSGLHRTRDSNGVLILLSCFERRVVVLGDRGIHEKLGDHHWDEVRDRIIEGIHSGKAREGICAAIESCGNALAQYFPRLHDDVNELSDAVIDRRMRPDAP